MKHVILGLVLAGVLAGCSTAGGIYQSGSSEHGEFSLGRTMLTVLGVAAGVAAARRGGGGGSAQGGIGGFGYAWDYQPENGQWVCRDRSNGEYADKENCSGLPVVDNWR